MSTRAFGIGIESFSKKLVDYLNDSIKAMLIDLTQVDTQVKAISAATNATPIAITSTAHGAQDGDIIVMRGVGGNTSANGTYKVQGSTTNAFNLQTLDGQNVVGNGAYTSGGTFINLTRTANLGDINAGRVGTDQTLGTKTDVGGLLNCAALTFAGITGNVDGVIIYFNGGTDATSIPLFFIDGKALVRGAADAAISATTWWVEKIAGAINNGTAMVTSAGVTATLTSAPSQFARSLAVSALSGAIAAGHQADVPTTGAGFPFTGGGGSYTVTPDTGANKLFNLNAA